MYFVDTETCGLTGPIVILQYAEDQGNVIIYEVWKEPVRKTLKLIERLMNNEYCGFNIAFDLFHINKLYNMFHSVKDISEPPRPDEVATYKNVSYCCKPVAALDLLLYIRKTHLQILDRREVRIRRVPNDYAMPIAALLEKTLSLPGIYFYKRTDGYKWNVDYSKDVDFPDVVLRFGATSKLKPIIAEIFKVEVLDYPIPNEYLPEEVSYNPYTTGWTKVINKHIEFWSTNKTARSYAENDVIYLQRLHKYFDSPPAGDDDSELAVSVGASRWKGFAIDITALKHRLLACYKKIAEAAELGININSSVDVKRKLVHLAPPGIVIKDSSAQTLKILGTKLEGMPIADIANKIRLARNANKEKDILEKLLEVGKFCPEFKVIGTKSGRMSGGGEEGFKSLNPQGIPRNKYIRQIFTFANNNMVLSGGDAIGFEVVITQAATDDDVLKQDLIRDIKSFHAWTGEQLYDMLYNDVLASKGTTDDKYTKAKNTNFAYIYGAVVDKISKTAEVSEQKAQQWLDTFSKRYVKISNYKQLIYDAFCSMQQPKGIGTAVIWRDPPEYVASLLGFRRYFTIENKICKALYLLGTNLPSNFNLDGRVFRKKDKQQTKRGALQSALFAAAFQLQAFNMRAAFNHIIQSTGGELTKKLQRSLWDLQPNGIHPWSIQVFNMHDEVICVHTQQLVDIIKQRVDTFVNEYRKVVPLLAFDWRSNVKNWAECK